jgi:hypothetical protein
VRSNGSFDLHALSTPPAFILDQDQILCKDADWRGFHADWRGNCQFLFRVDLRSICVVLRLSWDYEAKLFLTACFKTMNQTLREDPRIDPRKSAC